LKIQIFNPLKFQHFSIVGVPWHFTVICVCCCEINFVLCFIGKVSLKQQLFSRLWLQNLSQLGQMCVTVGKNFVLSVGSWFSRTDKGLFSVFLPFNRKNWSNKNSPVTSPNIDEMSWHTNDVYFLKFDRLRNLNFEVILEFPKMFLFLKLKSSICLTKLHLKIWFKLSGLFLKVIWIWPLWPFYATSSPVS
jgi:hypothetical protein